MEIDTPNWIHLLYFA